MRFMPASRESCRLCPQGFPPQWNRRATGGRIRLRAWQPGRNSAPRTCKPAPCARTPAKGQGETRWREIRNGELSSEKASKPYLIGNQPVYAIRRRAALGLFMAPGASISALVSLQTPAEFTAQARTGRARTGVCRSQSDRGPGIAGHSAHSEEKPGPLV